MKNFKFIFALLFTLAFKFLLAGDTSPREFQLQEGIKIVLPSLRKAKKLLSTPDEYSKRLSQFDVQAKLMDSNRVRQKDYLSFARKQARKWTQEELETLEINITNIGEKLRALNLELNLPSSIEIIKTTGLEEGGAAYTRGHFIVLNEKLMHESLLIHELFHVFSRHNPETREKLYAILGFKKCNEIDLTEALKYKITNPDAPINNYYLNLKVKESTVKACMVLYSDEKYVKGSFFEYLKTGLLELEQNGEQFSPKRDDQEKLVIYRFDQANTLFEQIGKNTRYNIHPEEISAEHFVLLLSGQSGLPDPGLVESMRKVLSKN